MKLGFKKANRGATNIVVFGQVCHDPLPKSVLLLSIPHNRILKNMLEAFTQLMLLFHCEIGPLLGLQSCKLELR
jgi:hypothetical protein